jgi:homoserine kinase
MNKIRIQSPATIANLVCGFDILGLALEAPYDIMEVIIKEEPGITLSNSEAYNLPTNPQENVASIALQALMNSYEKPIGFHVHIDKQIKPGSGLGSSAASSAGAVFAANQLLGNPFSKQQLVNFAMQGEKFASGSPHADNVTPCLFGGVTLIRSTEPLDIVPLGAPKLYVTVVHPQIEVKTSDARKILRKDVLLKDAIKQWGNIAGLVSGILQNDIPLIGRSLEDVIIEPIRSILIPGFHQVKSKSIEIGALGGGISGSGPSVFMLSENISIATAVEKEMQFIYHQLGIEYKTYVTTINNTGVKIL